MLNRYKKSILTLLDQLNEAKKAPSENPIKWFKIQETVLNKIIYVEKQIRKQKALIKKFNFIRKNPTKRLDKLESLEIKDKIEYCKYKIGEYRFIISTYNSIGDGIAFTFLSKFDIKPLNIKQSPGFISNKEGLRAEKRIFKAAYKAGVIAILNDITSVLKYGDVTVLNNDHISFLEVKSSSNVNSRVLRQKEKSEKIINYLITDQTDELYGVKENVTRISSNKKEKNYIPRFNELLINAELNGFSYSLIEKGLLYFIDYNSNAINELESISEFKLMSKPFAFHLNSSKFLEMGYYPFSLSFSKSNYYWDFLIGKINVIIFIEMKEIQAIAKKHGFEVFLSKKEGMAFKFKSINKSNDVSSIEMSEHYFFRAHTEFVSLKWLISDIFINLGNRISGK